MGIAWGAGGMDGQGGATEGDLGHGLRRTRRYRDERDKEGDAGDDGKAGRRMLWGMAWGCGITPDGGKGMCKTGDWAGKWSSKRKNQRGVA